MRLTKTDKEAFVRAVMDDVPKIDYDEQVRSLMAKWGREPLPEELRPMVKKYPQYFNDVHVYTPAYCPNVNAVCNPDWAYNGFKDCEPEKYAELAGIGVLNHEQDEARQALERKVAALINPCSTLKMAKERLPEFEKYLPAERGGFGTVNLPVANTVADLMNAGWPKGEQHAAA